MSSQQSSALISVFLGDTKKLVRISQSMSYDEFLDIINERFGDELSKNRYIRSCIDEFSGKDISTAIQFKAFVKRALYPHTSVSVRVITDSIETDYSNSPMKRRPSHDTKKSLNGSLSISTHSRHTKHTSSSHTASISGIGSMKDDRHRRSSTAFSGQIDDDRQRKLDKLTLSNSNLNMVDVGDVGDGGDDDRTPMEDDTALLEAELITTDQTRAHRSIDRADIDDDDDDIDIDPTPKRTALTPSRSPQHNHTTNAHTVDETFNAMSPLRAMHSNTDSDDGDATLGVSRRSSRLLDDFITEVETRVESKREKQHIGAGSYGLNSSQKSMLSREIEIDQRNRAKRYTEVTADLLRQNSKSVTTDSVDPTKPRSYRTRTHSDPILPESLGSLGLIGQTRENRTLSVASDALSVELANIRDELECKMAQTDSKESSRQISIGALTADNLSKITEETNGHSSSLAKQKLVAQQLNSADVESHPITEATSIDDVATTPQQQTLIQRYYPLNTTHYRLLNEMRVNGCCEKTMSVIRDWIAVRIVIFLLILFPIYLIYGILLIVQIPFGIVARLIYSRCDSRALSLTYASRYPTTISPMAYNLVVAPNTTIDTETSIDRGALRPTDAVIIDQSSPKQSTKPTVKSRKQFKKRSITESDTVLSSSHTSPERRDKRGVNDDMYDTNEQSPLKQEMIAENDEKSEEADTVGIIPINRNAASQMITETEYSIEREHVEDAFTMMAPSGDVTIDESVTANSLPNIGALEARISEAAITEPKALESRPSTDDSQSSFRIVTLNMDGFTNESYLRIPAALQTLMPIKSDIVCLQSFYNTDMGSQTTSDFIAHSNHTSYMNYWEIYPHRIFTDKLLFSEHFLEDLKSGNNASVCMRIVSYCFHNPLVYCLNKYVLAQLNFFIYNHMFDNAGVPSNQKRESVAFPNSIADDQIVTNTARVGDEFRYSTDNISSPPQPRAHQPSVDIPKNDLIQWQKKNSEMSLWDDFMSYFNGISLHLSNVIGFKDNQCTLVSNSFDIFYVDCNHSFQKCCFLLQSGVKIMVISGETNFIPSQKDHAHSGTVSATTAQQLSSSPPNGDNTVGTPMKQTKKKYDTLLSPNKVDIDGDDNDDDESVSISIENGNGGGQSKAHKKTYDSVPLTTNTHTTTQAIASVTPSMATDNYRKKRSNDGSVSMDDIYNLELCKKLVAFIESNNFYDRCNGFILCGTMNVPSLSPAYQYLTDEGYQSVLALGKSTNPTLNTFTWPTPFVPNKKHAFMMNRRTVDCIWIKGLKCEWCDVLGLKPVELDDNNTDVFGSSHAAVCAQLSPL